MNEEGTEMRLNNATLVVVPGRFMTAIPVMACVAAAGCAFWLSRHHTNALRQGSLVRSPVPTIVHSAIGELRAQRKLVVLQATVTADVMKRNERRILGVSLGETSVLVRAPGRVQFVVPLDQLTDDSIAYDAPAKKLILRVPRPMPDRDMVGIDPAQISVWRSIGWCRLRGSASELESEATTEIIPQAVLAADNDWLQARAEDEARSVMSKLARQAFRGSGDSLAIEIQYSEPRR
jgi:hypothetical protein